MSKNNRFAALANKSKGDNSSKMKEKNEKKKVEAKIRKEEFFIQLQPAGALESILGISRNSRTSGVAPQLRQPTSNIIEYDPTLYTHQRGTVRPWLNLHDAGCIIAGRSGLRAILELLSGVSEASVLLHVFSENSIVCIDDIRKCDAEKKRWGFNFEYIMTNRNSNEQNEQREPYFEIATMIIPDFSGNLINRTLNIVCETDCIDDKGNSKELKTIRRGVDRNYKSKYFQVLFSNVSRIVIGEIDNTSTPNTFSLSELSRDDLQMEAFPEMGELLGILHSFSRILSCLACEYATRNGNTGCEVEITKNNAQNRLEVIERLPKPKETVADDGFNIVNYSRARFERIFSEMP